MSDNNFSSLYKTWATDKLLDIIDNAGEYQPAAVEAANLEIKNRQLSEEQLTASRKIQEERRQHEKNKTQVFERSLHKVASSVEKVVRPNYSANAMRYIKIISLLLCGIFLFNVYKDWGFVPDIILRQDEWDFTTLFLVLSILMVPVSTLLFWFGKRAGWILTAVYFSFNAASSISLLISSLRRPSFPALDNLLPQPSPVLHLLSLITFAGLSWMLCKPEVRERYNIDKTLMIVSLVIGAGFIVIMSLLL